MGYNGPNCIWRKCASSFKQLLHLRQLGKLTLDLFKMDNVAKGIQGFKLHAEQPARSNTHQVPAPSSEAYKQTHKRKIDSRTSFRFHFQNRKKPFIAFFIRYKNIFVVFSIINL